MSADESGEGGDDSVAQDLVDGMADMIENAESALAAAREGGVESELDRVSVETLPVDANAMMEIEAEYPEWVVHEADDGSLGWRNTERGEFVMASTPDGVPEGYEYLPPGEDPPDDRDVAESDAGGTYIGPPGSAGEDTGPDGGAGGGTDVPEEGVTKTDSGAYVSADPDPEVDIDRFMEDAEATEAIEQMNAEPMGGFTVQRNLETYDVEDDDVWICGMASVEFDAEDGVSKEDVVEFYEEYQEVLEEKTGIRIGGYHFESGEKMSIDLSAALTDREEAEALGEELNQESVFNPKVALGDGNWDDGSVSTGGDGDSPLNDADPDEILETLNVLDSVTSEARGVLMRQETEDGGSAADDVFENDDGETLTRRQIGYRGWKEGGVETDGEAFLVGGVRYEPVDDAE